MLYKINFAKVKQLLVNKVNLARKYQKYKTNIFFRLCFVLKSIIALNIKYKIFRSKFYLIILMVNIFSLFKINFAKHF